MSDLLVVPVETITCLLALRWGAYLPSRDRAALYR